MKSSEEELFNYIKQKLPKNVSFIDKIAEVLDLSYDAAYRRVNRKTALNLAETLKLANHYNIDLNTLLLSTNNSKRIIVEKTHHLIEDDYLQTFLDKSSNEIEKLRGIGRSIINKLS
ncbi:helix-turn-helix domain-containing protein [Polaribacter sejongensis]|uniref:helix-turn-helix domain-containing protein n=1 Tax=Polaribacter sejongensis TaxID=985043 RepID=UPI0035A7121D